MINTATAAIITILLSGQITVESSVAITNKLIDAERNGQEVILDINSEGGSVIGGNAIINQVLNSKTKITCKVNKMAASMAAFLISACPIRDVSDNATIIYHTIYSKVDGLGAARTYQTNLMSMDMLRKYNAEKLFTKEQMYTFMLGGDILLTGKQFKAGISK